MFKIDYWNKFKIRFCIQYPDIKFEISNVNISYVPNHLNAVLTVTAIETKSDNSISTKMFLRAFF